MTKGGKGRLERRQIWCDSIQTSKILKRVQEHTIAKESDVDYEDTRMTATQMKGAEMLLRKTLPDLKAIEGVINVDMNIIKPKLPDYLDSGD